jgi:ABC-2 type transport system ATP-binding protein
MWQTIRTLVKKGSTVLLTTQYLDEADQLADQIIVIDRGHVVANDTPSSLKQSIGAASMQVVLKDAGKITVAMQIIEKTLGVSSQLSEGTALTAPMDDTNKLTDVLTTLKESDIVLTSVNVRQPTLDEVFFALTGNVTKETKEAI